MPSTRWLDDREARAWRGYLTMRTLLDLAVGRDLSAETELSATDYSILALLSEAPEGRMQMVVLGSRLYWSNSRLSHQLSRMQARGLVRREPHVDNQRAVDAVITEDGLQAIRTAAPAHVESVRRHLIDLLTDQEIDTLGSIAEKVVDHLTADAEIRDDERGGSAE